MCPNFWPVHFCMTPENWLAEGFFLGNIHLIYMNTYHDLRNDLHVMEVSTVHVGGVSSIALQ